MYASTVALALIALTMLASALTLASVPAALSATVCAIGAIVATVFERLAKG